MHSKLAGHLPLQDMIQNTITGARAKLAAAEGKDEKKGFPFAKKDDKAEAKKKALLKYEEKEHGHIPTPKEEEEEKKASALDFSNFGDMDKLASALDELGDEFLKEADSIENGGESHQGGEQLPTGTPVKGTQPYKKDKARHQVPHGPVKTQSTVDNPGASTAVETDDKRAPGGNGAKYPTKGVLKTAAMDDSCTCDGKGTCAYCKKMDAKKEKKASPAVNFILGKIAEYKGGGETLDSKSGVGPKPASDSAGGNDARKAIESNTAAINMKKVDGKKPQKRQLSQVLTEPAQTKSTDSKVSENLQNAAKGGVKIAAAKAYLAKVASDPSHPKYEALKAAIAKTKEEKAE